MSSEPILRLPLTLTLLTQRGCGNEEHYRGEILFGGTQSIQENQSNQSNQATSGKFAGEMT